MKKIYLSLSFLATLIISENVIGQDQLFTCGQVDAEEQLLADPEMRSKIKSAEVKQKEWIAQFKDHKSGERSDADYTVPVVFHVIHNFGSENISDEQINDAIRVLNEDFQLKNADANNVIGPFKNIVGNPKIEFKLAKIDPHGNCTNGIVRVANNETYYGRNYGSNPALANISRWPRENYLNIWVVAQIQSGAAGYTYRPASVNNAPLLDGIVILHNYTGSIGTGTYGRSRALTHEVGHWIDLPHTWGNSNTPGLASNCDEDDGIADTPETIGNRTCNLAAESCGSLDNVQNYMDYSYCYAMFTEGQATRMRAALTSSISNRDNLWSSSNLATTGVFDNSLCQAKFGVNKYDICAGQSITVTDNSYNNPVNWNWSFVGGSPSTSTQPSTTVTYPNPGTYSIKLSVTNGNQVLDAIKNDIITVWDNNGTSSPIFEHFDINQIPNKDWVVNNPDGAVTWKITTLPDQNNVVMLDNIRNISGRVDELLSATIDATTLESIAVSFKLAYAQRMSTDEDELELYVSSNCGETWSRRWSAKGQALATTDSIVTPYTPKQEDWRTINITNLPNFFLVSNFRFKFVFTSGRGNNIYLDDIFISSKETVGIEEVKQEKLKELTVYPNPFSNETTVAFSLEESQKVQMSLTDMLGKESILLPANHILHSGQHTFRLNKSEMNLTRGIYFLRVITEGKPQIKKIIIQ